MLEDTSQLIAGRRGAVCRGLEKPLYRLYQVLVNSRSVEEGEAQIEFAAADPDCAALRYHLTASSALRAPSSAESGYMP